MGQKQKLNSYYLLPCRRSRPLYRPIFTKCNIISNRTNQDCFLRPVFGSNNLFENVNDVHTSRRGTGVVVSMFCYF